MNEELYGAKHSRLQKRIRVEMKNIYDTKEINQTHVQTIQEYGKDLTRMIDAPDRDALNVSFNRLSQSTDQPFDMLMQLKSIDDHLEDMASNYNS